MSTSLLKEQAAKAAAKVAHMAETTKKFPPFRMDLPKRIHVPKHVKSADLRMRIALSNKPRDFRREHLVISTSRTRRDALPLEKLGEWDPKPRMRRLLPSSSSSSSAGQADLSFAGKNAVRFEKRIELSGEKIRWWLEEGGAVPTKSVVKLLEECGLLIKGEHPFSYVPKDRPVTQQKPSGHWPEYDPPSPARTPGAIVRGTTYILPGGDGAVRRRYPDVEQQTAEATAKLEADLLRKREEKASAQAQATAERLSKKASDRAEREQEREAVVDAYRAKVAEVQERRAMIEAEELAAVEAAAAAARAAKESEEAAAAKQESTTESSAAAVEEEGAVVESTPSSGEDAAAASQTTEPASSPPPSEEK